VIDYFLHLWIKRCEHQSVNPDSTSTLVAWHMKFLGARMGILLPFSIHTELSPYSSGLLNIKTEDITNIF